MTKTTGPTVICAWCEKLMASGTRAVSHGICRSCARSFMASVTDTRKGTTPNRPYAKHACGS